MVSHSSTKLIYKMGPTTLPKPLEVMVVHWKSADGKHHLQTGNLRCLLGLIAKSGEEQDAEPTDSIIEVI